MSKMLFDNLLQKKDGLIKGPFGGDIKKSLFVPKTDDAYKVYEQGVVLKNDVQFGDYYISKEHFEKSLKRFEVKSGDILMTGAGTLGKLFYVPEIHPKGVINQALLRIRLNESIITPSFFKYYFKYYIEAIISRLNGDSVIPNLPPLPIIKSTEIDIPIISIQKSIAKVLSDLDAKIELNNRINRELEAMAKTLYDYWFVQFDFPVRTLSGVEGYKSSGGKMVYNAELKREIPEGWEVKTLLDIATYTNGLACQKFRPTNEEFLPVIKIREMRDGFTEGTEKVKADIPEKLIVNNGDVLFSWSASLEVMIWTGGKGGLNQHIFKVTSRKYPRSFYYFQLIWYLQHFKMIAELRKTTMGHITQDHLKQSRIVVPPIDVVRDLDKQLKNIQEKQILISRQNQHLTALRDWLLPMLMNGQVTVRQAHGKLETEERLNMAAEPSVEYKKEEKLYENKIRK